MIMEKEISVFSYDIDYNSDAGLMVEFNCPDCDEAVRLAMFPWWDTSCSCRDWSFTFSVNGCLKSDLGIDEISANQLT